MPKFAVIKTGGKQYVVEPGKKLKIEKIKGEVNDSVNFDNVLLLADDKDVKIGAPVLKDALVEAKILKQAKAKKVVVSKYKSKTRYFKTKGHRQMFTEVEITKI